MYIVVLIETNLLANFVSQNSKLFTTAAIMFRNVLPERFSVCVCLIYQRVQY